MFKRCWDFPEDFGGHEILEPLRVVAGSVNRYTVRINDYRFQGVLELLFESVAL